MTGTENNLLTYRWTVRRHSLLLCPVPELSVPAATVFKTNTQNTHRCPPTARLKTISKPAGHKYPSWSFEMTQWEGNCEIPPTLQAQHTMQADNVSNAKPASSGPGTKWKHNINTNGDHCGGIFPFGSANSQWPSMKMFPCLWITFCTSVDSGNDPFISNRTGSEPQGSGFVFQM